MSIIENTIIENTLLITLNNPEKRNSMIPGFHDELQESIRMAEPEIASESLIVFLRD